MCKCTLLDNGDYEEVASLRNIDDSFKKIIIIGEDTPILRNEAGITTIGVYMTSF